MKTNRLFGLFTGLLFSLVALAQPKPGDVFREYVWVTPRPGAAEDFLRVTDDGRYVDLTNKERDFFPEGFVQDGWLTFSPQVDLKHAIRAEIQIEKVLCHDGSKGLAIKLNDSDWKTFPEGDSIPYPQWEYLHHFYPIVPIDVSDLQEGTRNRFRFKIDQFQRFGMPQNLIYGVILRVYYDAAKPHTEARLSSPANGSIAGEIVDLAIRSDRMQDITRVDYLAYYEDVNYEGDGIYTQWHYNYYRGNLIHNIATATQNPFPAVWNTEWIPDQPVGIKIAARITDKNGLIYFTQAIEDVTISRDYHVRLYKPYNCPKRWATREGEFVTAFDLGMNPEKVQKFQLVFTSWSPGYMNGIFLNDYNVFVNEGCNYCYHFSRITINEGYKLGWNNSIKTGKTPLKFGSMVHGTEIQYPGIQVLVRYNAD